MSDISEQRYGEEYRMTVDSAFESAKGLPPSGSWPLEIASQEVAIKTGKLYGYCEKLTRDVGLFKRNKLGIVRKLRATDSDNSDLILRTIRNGQIVKLVEIDLDLLPQRKSGGSQGRREAFIDGAVRYFGYQAFDRLPPIMVGANLNDVSVGENRAVNTESNLNTKFNLFDGATRVFCARDLGKNSIRAYLVSNIES